MTAKGNATLVEALGSSLMRGGNALEAVPGLLKRVLVEDAWREFVTLRGELVTHTRFDDFVTAQPLRGIGATRDLVRRMIDPYPEVVDLFDQAYQQRPGNPGNVNNINVRPTGTSQDAALRRLRKDSPELHAEVLAGHLTAHGAMVKAGYRRHMFSIPVGDPARVAKTLRRQLPPQELAELVALLTEDHES